MYFSIHYYVLLLDDKSIKLFEGFRETLFEISNGGFPYRPSFTQPTTVGQTSIDSFLNELYIEVNRLFEKFYNQNPLGLVLVGEKKKQSIFKSVLNDRKCIFREIEGNYDTASPDELGRVIWSNVKETLAGTHERALRELALALSAKKVASGLEEVWQIADSGKGTILLVEDDFRMKGSIVKTAYSSIISEQVDIRKVFDDVVDQIIDRVLELGGTVVFLDNGLLAEHQRIALIYH
ncbi:hypothetical protein GF337_14580 [candidate division KSB1 bacterium]|nr:hypothetical protein [candidate division KSB1 bacterium]